MKPLPHDRRQEAPADLSGFTPAEIACLADLAKGRLRRFPKGYALCNELGERVDRAQIHVARVVWSLQDKGVVRLVVIIGGTDARIAVLTPGDGTAAWIARTAAKARS